MAFDRAIAVLTIFCEASNQPLEARKAVAHVLLNRLTKGEWGQTVAAVCLTPYQFSEWLPDRPDARNMRRAANTPDDDAVMLACGQAYDIACAEGDFTGGATHFYADSISAPSWTVGATKTGKWGNLYFFRDVA